MMTAVDKRKLPIGIQTFRQIREEGYYYVDKTTWARRLEDDAGKHYFLSRPRRFGKSLFVDTLKELYEGSEELFRGLAVHDGWDWSRRHPVVRLDFSSGDFADPEELHRNLMQQFDLIERDHGMESGYDTPRGRFLHLLRELHRRAGRRVVVLVDEYDKPILDAIDDVETATLNRRRLRGLYGTIKFADAHIELTFITGVSKFSKVSIFSDLNNLIDVTLDPAYAAICGYTEADLDTVFAPELPGLERDAIRTWYNGYHWLGEERLYNPFGLLMLFRSRMFKAHWFETATPRFLIDTLIRSGFAAPNLEGVYASETLLSSFDVEAIAPEALLFQTGYLTIVDEQDDDGYRQYRLGYPNREVRRSLNESLLDTLAPHWQQAARAGTGAGGAALRRLLAARDWAGLEALFRALLAGIPHDWHRRNDVARYEGYWASVFYAFFQASLDGVSVEDATSRGRLDLAVVSSGTAWLFEFKIAERSKAGAALTQLKERRYADKHRAACRAVYLIGVEISAEQRAIAAFAVESA